MTLEIDAAARHPVDTAPTNYHPIRQMQLALDRHDLAGFGKVIEGAEILISS